MRIFLIISLMLTSTALSASEQPGSTLKQGPTEKPLLQAKVLMKQGQYADAIQVYSMLLVQNPFSAVAANNLALAHTAVGDYTVALEFLEKAVRIAPKRKDITANLTSMRVWLEKYPDASLHPYEPDKIDTYATMVPPKLW